MLAQPAGDLPQQFVTDVVTQRVVDRLEAIEIDKQDGKWCVFALTATHRSRELFDKQAAVRQVGQFVILRKFLKLTIALRLIGIVAEGDYATDQISRAVVQALAVDR